MNEQKQPQGTVSPIQAANITGIDETTIISWIRNASLPCIKIKNRRYIKISDIWAIFERGDTRFLRLLKRAGIGLVMPEWAKEENDESD